ncbi:Gamma-2-syntrophin [Chelonia mydas]|uniref:Gamma-2-syntrophin n=1 Tax=Chelonia mydas TaxID=8469 RepID=M7C5F9_CHEMY|nr:Gamma-2-syntrophin [Chelonia mydas]
MGAAGSSGQYVPLRSAEPVDVAVGADLSQCLACLKVLPHSYFNIWLTVATFNTSTNLVCAHFMNLGLIEQTRCDKLTAEPSSVNSGTPPEREVQAESTGERQLSTYHSEDTTAPSSPSSPIANEPKYEKHWLDTLSVPLSIARISRYKAGTDKLRSNAFEVLALDGVSTGILQFYTAQECADWLRALSTNISDLTLQNMKMANKCCSLSDQIIHMGWVNERLEGTDSSQLYKYKFLALKGSSFYIFSTPPVSTLDWVRAEKIYHLCEVLFKVHKKEKGNEKYRNANDLQLLYFSKTACFTGSPVELWNYAILQLVKAARPDILHRHNILGWG